MSNLVLFDNRHIDLLPLTFTRPVAEIRVGILTITQKWERFLGASASYATQDYLQPKFPLILKEDNLLVSGNVLPEELLITQIKLLEVGAGFKWQGEIVCVRLNELDARRFLNGEVDFVTMRNLDAEPITINRPYDIFRLNGVALELDFKQVTKGRKSGTLSASNRVVAPENIFVEEGAIVECAIINASTGPVYIGADAEIMEGAIVRGPFALCEHSVLKMGAKIYGPTTIGPYSKVGGEVSNSVIFGMSNKAHDGFLGNSVLGEWCNLGADTNNSNLKNNYEEVKLWSYREDHFVKTGLQFCGLIMGDHSKCGINTMFNTGTVVGVSANIYGDGFPRNFIPSFSWGGAASMIDYRIDKALQTAERVWARRGIELSQVDQDILLHIYNNTPRRN
ncbi:GlmU family protein [Williamwhitmania taraxaci]|uniref:UDP-N-acetylglucosamine diphosphorylase/glucosamine-1-phosphate N-acetyltransferase n=1 Tax=Williamwhitmania taraxaci TaxID=1640674 RepID=A0A1G6LCJ3_9BACT|nr:GlmU family protein [Williamwhitmania taraxaci]SDC41009.1 UDP-N-acetylglucosamine diphosphorylase/glucosamine-1-phosphate N-acetyltransferase [Williamwhitmania taraxaci]